MSNLKFSLHVEPDNEATKSKLDWALKQREQSQPTIPSTIAEEKSYNPFMRVQLDPLKKRYGVTDPVQCMQALRKEKDNWKPT